MIDSTDRTVDAFATGNTVIMFRDLREGFKGSYDPADRFDEPLLRIEVGRIVAGNRIEPLDNASRLTLVPAHTPARQRRRLLALAMGHVAAALERGDRLDGVCEDLSWISDDWTGELPWTLDRYPIF